jgi:hypothetical protein
MSPDRIRIPGGTEDPKARTPAPSLVLAYAAMVPVVAGTAGTLATRGRASATLARLTLGWAGAVLCFLSGVRRGIRQPGGPTAAQLGAMLWLFAAGAGSLLMPRRVPAILALLLGYGTEAVIDPAAARRGEAPRFFARLRPVQLLLPLSCLLLLLATESGRPRGDAKR